MKVTLAVLALAASASAFTAPAAERTTTALGMDRRGAFAQIGVVAAGLASVPAMASADGSVSASTISRARGIYGDRIANLKPAVADGNFAAVVDEKAAFVLFNSGAYPKNKGKKAVAIAGTNKIFAAIRSKDKAGLSSAYSEYITDNSINAFPATTGVDGQGSTGDYDFKSHTKAGAVYQR